MQWMKITKNVSIHKIATSEVRNVYFYVNQISLNFIGLKLKIGIFFWRVNSNNGYFSVANMNETFW